MGHVRHRFHGPSTLAPHPAAPTWQGHPLRKDHPARATEMEPFRLPQDKEDAEQETLRFHPEEWGMRRAHEGTDFMFLNLGPNHPERAWRVSHRIAARWGRNRRCRARYRLPSPRRRKNGRAPDLAYLYSLYRPRRLSGRGDEQPAVCAGSGKTGRHRSARASEGHPRDDGGVFPHRQPSGVLWHLAQDLGALSPVFYMFTDRERVFDIVEAICGGRMHPSWFRIGGVAQDLPKGWDRLMRISRLSAQRLDEYDKIALGNRILKARTRGVGSYTVGRSNRVGRHRAGLARLRFRLGLPQGAGPTRATTSSNSIFPSAAWRLLRPLRSARRGNSPEPAHHRAVPEPYAGRPLQGGSSAYHAAAKRTHHAGHRDPDHSFPGRELGTGDTAGRSICRHRSTKGNNGYYLISDGSTMPYRVRIRTPPFRICKRFPLISRGLMVADLIAILGSIDFVMADVDR